MSICVSMCPFLICFPIGTFMHLSICSSAQLTTYLYVKQSICPSTTLLSVCVFVCSSVCTSLRPTVRLFTFVSVKLSICPFIHQLFIYLWFHPSISLSFKQYLLVKYYFVGFLYKYICDFDYISLIFELRGIDDTVVIDTMFRVFAMM